MPDDGNQKTQQPAARRARLRALVDDHIDFVARSLRNLGVPEADIDDAVQRTFLVAARRFDEIRPGAEKAFLFRTAVHDAAHVRRTLARRREVPEAYAGEQSHLVSTPEQLADRNRARNAVDRILGEMDLDLRSVFILYEIEEMTMAEIAITFSIPTGTVASRLRRAREDFRKRVRRLNPSAPRSEDDD